MKAWMATGMVLMLGYAAFARAQADTVTVHRCVDAKGRVTLQDEACPPGSKGSARRMQRPVDAPPRPPSEEKPREPEPEPVDYPPDYGPLPPPPMYRCTSYDGIVRYSENPDPNPRCEPLGLYVPPGRLTPEVARTCRWVKDSCVRLSDEQACAVWRKKQAEARSKALHAFSDTDAYWESELERTSQVIRESCG